MGNKSYYAVISVMLVSMVSMFYLFYGSGEEKNPALNEKVAIEESAGSDDVGGVITPAAKKFEIREQRRARKVQQTAAMKQYEKEDSDTFIARIENNLEEARYEAESAYLPPEEIEMVSDEIQERLQEREEEILSSHRAILLALNSPDEHIDESYEMDSAAMDHYEDDIASYDANYDYQ